MKQTLAAYQQRFADLLQLAAQTRESFQALSRNVLYKQRLQELRAGGLALLDELYSENHTYYGDFKKLVAEQPSLKQIDAITRLLQQALAEREEYDQPPVPHTNPYEEDTYQALRKGNGRLAVAMAGSALEKHLAQLCAAHDIKFTGPADRVGSEQRNLALLRQGLYNRTKQQQVSEWIGLRNRAVHSVQTEYNLAEVEQMLRDVFDFVASFPLPAGAAEPPAPESPAPAATPSPEAQAKTLKNMRKRLRQIKEILAAEDITDAKKLKKIRFVVNLLLPDKEQPGTEKAPA